MYANRSLLLILVLIWKEALIKRRREENLSLQILQYTTPGPKPQTAMGAGSATAAKKRQKQRPQLRPKKSIGKNKIKGKKKKSSDNNTKNNIKKNDPEMTVVKLKSEITVIERPTVSQQLSFFIDQYQSANAVQLSSLELDSLKGCPFSNLTWNLCSVFHFLLLKCFKFYKFSTWNFCVVFSCFSLSYVCC